MADPTDEDMVRFLINDPKLQDGSPVFSDEEIAGYLALEGGSVKLAAAQALDTIADNEALASKYIRDHQLTVDGTKVADSLRKRAASLRVQADEGDGGFFEVIDFGSSVPELTERPYF